MLFLDVICPFQCVHSSTENGSFSQSQCKTFDGPSLVPISFFELLKFCVRTEKKHRKTTEFQDQEYVCYLCVCCCVIANYKQVNSCLCVFVFILVPRSAEVTPAVNLVLLRSGQLQDSIQSLPQSCSWHSLGTWLTQVLHFWPWVPS